MSVGFLSAERCRGGSQAVEYWRSSHVSDKKVWRDVRLDLPVARDTGSSTGKLRLSFRLVTSTPSVAGDNSDTSFSWCSGTALVPCLRAKNRDGLADGRPTCQCSINGSKPTCDQSLRYLKRSRQVTNGEENFQHLGCTCLATWGTK